MNAPLHVIHRDECIRLRSSGLTWDEIASNIGIASASARFSVLDDATKRRVRGHQNEKRNAREVRHALHEKREPRASAQMIIRVVAEAYGLSPGDIKSRVLTRGRTASGHKTIDYITPRHVAMYLCKNMKSMSSSFPRIASQFCRRNPSTVRFACLKIAAMMEADESFRAKVEELRAAVMGQVGSGE